MLTSSVLQSYQPHAYSEEDRRLLEMLAAHAGIALENARLFQAERRRAEETAALLATSQAITSLDLDVVLEAIASHAKALFKADGSRIHLLEPDGESLRCAIALHERAEAIKAYPLKVGEGITGRVAHTGVPEIIPNTLDDPDMLQVPGTPVEPESLALAPLRIGERVIGVMTVTRLGEERPFVADDLPLLTAFANQAAVAIENARLYSSLQATNRDLQAALRAKEEMIQNVSHELRTPLALIMGYGEMLAGNLLGSLSEEQANAVTVMNQQAHRLHVLVERLLTLQTLDQAALRKGLVDLAGLLARLQQTWRPQAAKAGIRLRLDLADDLPLLMADGQLLIQAVDNLIENAIKFSPQGDVVAIKAWRESDEVIIAVTDQGIGLTPEQQERIFERFYQADGSLSRRFGGMGIGLALCRAIVTAHEGRIWAESEGEGRGSTFYVALPLDSSTLPKTETPNKEGSS